MLSYAYIGEGWDFVAIRSLDDGLAAIKDTTKQLFFFDDFLGKVALDRRALAHKDSDIARFIRRVRASVNARFILTSRAYILEEARRFSEHLADQRLDIVKYLLNVSKYTRRVKARILYNHLLVAGPPQTHITALVESGLIPKIVDHKNYMPRIVEWMTDIQHMGNLAADIYPQAFIHALAHPGQLWDVAFRTHISKSCQHLLFTLFFSSEFFADIDDVRFAYSHLHHYLCSKYGEASDPKDFDEAVRILEGGFITLTGTSMSFVNPSLRDYLTQYLQEPELLYAFAACARETRWAQALWWHGRSLKLSEGIRQRLALTFFQAAILFAQLPTWTKTESGAHPCGLSNTDRIELLLEWWEVSKDDRFSELALGLAREPVDGFSSWRDGTDTVTLIQHLRQQYYYDLPCETELANILEDAVVHMIESGVASDELEGISDAVEEGKDQLGDRVRNAIHDAIKAEFRDVDDTVSHIYSDSTLNEHLETLQKLGTRISIPASEVDAAISTIRDRIAELEEHTTPSRSPSIGQATNISADTFDDVELRNLFAPLVRP